MTSPSYNIFDYLTDAQIADITSYSASLDISTELQGLLDTLHTAGGGIIFYNYGAALLLKPIRLYANTTIMGGGGGVYGFSTKRGGATFVQSASAGQSVVDAVVIGSEGSGYTSASITFSNGATGAVSVSGGEVVAVRITDCGVATTDPITATLTGDGSGATLSVQTSAPMFYQAGSTGAIINMQNITLIGNNSSTSAGIVLSNAGPFFSNFRAYEFGLSAWRRMGGAGGHIIGGHIFGCGRGGMSAGTQSYFAGALDDAGNDLQMSNLEVGAGPSGDMTNLWNSAIHLAGGGSAMQLSNIVAEGADVGILCSAGNVMVSNVRCDINYGHGFWLHRTSPVLSPPSSTKIWGLWCHRNGRYAVNSYDNLRIESGDSIANTQVRGYSSTTAGSDGVQQRYGLYDGSGSADVSAFRDEGAGTAKFVTLYNYSPGPEQSRTGLTTLAATTPLNVTGQREIRLSNGADAVSVSLLTGGFHGDELVLIPTTDNITLVNGSHNVVGAILTAGGKSRVLTPWQAVMLRNSAGSWYEMQPWAKQAAIPGPTGGVNIDTEARAVISSILSAFQAIGLTS